MYTNEIEDGRDTLLVCRFVSNKSQNGSTDRAQKNWVFATNSNILIPISLQPDGVNLKYF